MKRLSALLCLLLAVVLLAGCGMMDGEMYVVAPHKLTESEDVQTRPAQEVADYAALQDAVLAMVNGRNESGVFRFTASYAGDVSADVSEVCMDIPNNTPLGAYAVYYMSASVNKYVSYYEAEVSITYKKSAVQISSIRAVDTMAAMNEQLRDIIENLGTYFVFETDNSRLNADYVSRQAQEIYYGNPDAVLAPPSVTVSTYPEEAKDRIVEVNISYPENVAVLRRLVGDLKETSTEITGWYAERETRSAVLSFCQYLSSRVTRKPLDESHWTADSSAYGALVAGTANSKGVAMALKVLCDARNIPCTVVSGRYANETHYWNIVSVDGARYHMDAAKFSENGGAQALFLSDQRIGDAYWWDTGAYPSCNGDLTYDAVLAQQRPVQPETSGEQTGETSGETQPEETPPQESSEDSGQTP